MGKKCPRCGGVMRKIGKVGSSETYWRCSHCGYKTKE